MAERLTPIPVGEPSSHCESGKSTHVHVAGGAVIVSGDAEGRGAAVAVSPEARAEGVLPGMGQGVAEKLCPNLVVLPLPREGGAHYGACAIGGPEARACFRKAERSAP